MVPADLIANERTRIRLILEGSNEETITPTIKKQERAIFTAAWQARWDRSSKERWTHRLIPDVGRWLTKPPLDLSFHPTQALSGHDSFRSYLHKIYRADDGYCVYCMDPDDKTEHTIFACPKWIDDRSHITDILRRPPNADDVEENLCGPRAEDANLRCRLVTQSAINGRELIAMIEAIMSTKENDERKEEAEPRYEAIRHRARRALPDPRRPR